MLTAN